MNRSYLISVVPLFLTIVSGLILSSSVVVAKNDPGLEEPTNDNNVVVDKVNLYIPPSCTLSGVGMDSHTATISPGTYNSEVGTTTMKASCNDAEGFAIYAIGYTNDTDGDNTLASTTLASPTTIATGTATSGDSQWAMKLATSSEATYPIELQNNFGAFHMVPDDYMLVAKRTAGTDVGAAAVGSVLTSTYQVFIATTQAAGTYVGQVKYVLVHPNYVDKEAWENAVTVIYNGNGSNFQNGTSTNTVKYVNACKPVEYAYVGNPTIIKSSNITDKNTYTAYESGEYVFRTITFDGADRIKVDVKYGLTGVADYEGGWVGIAEGVWGGLEGADSDGAMYVYRTWDSPDTDYLISGTKTFLLNGDTVTIEMGGYVAPVAGYDYGMYAEVYPVYDEATAGATYQAIAHECSVHPLSGAYEILNDSWYGTIGGNMYNFNGENEVTEFIGENISTLAGTTINLYNYNANNRIVYNGNNATAGTMSGFYTSTNESSHSVNLMAPNFKKTGYGFAGWSENQNATVNSGAIIYGPNERVYEDELSFDSNTHEATLYAVWVPSTGNMQNWSGCSSLTSGQVVALTDSRDNNVYTVGKMQDGNCWMMENLRLDDTATLNTNNTNISSVVFSSLPSTSDNWCSELQTSCTDQPMLNTNNTNIGGMNSNNISLISTPGLWSITYEDENGEHYAFGNNDHSQWYGYGNYYNWYSATGGASAIAIGTGTANSSICPSGWILPLAGPTSSSISGGISYLDIQLGGSGQWTNGGYDRWLSYPNNIVYSGTWKGNETLGRGSRGCYWSNYTNYLTYGLFFTKDQFDPGVDDGDGAFFGRTIRCLSQ